MISDEEYVSQEYHQLIDFTIRDCETDVKVYRIAYQIHQYSIGSYMEAVEYYRKEVAKVIADEFDIPVYITEVISDIPDVQ